MSIDALLKKWFPPAPDRAAIEPVLDLFYRTNNDYHIMTDSEDKTTHPQARLLDALISAEGKYIEVGCGGGRICEMVGRIARVHGFDVSELAIRRAAARVNNDRVSFMRASVEDLPVADDFADGTFSFEVLEHVWEPERALSEMVRVTKPGGFILVSAPNRFSLDLHLRKKRLARAFECLLALCRYCYDKALGHVHVNVMPDLNGNVYPDCDMISALIPANLPFLFRRAGCAVVFLDTFYLCAHNPKMGMGLSFQKNTGRVFLRYFGDHILLLARKQRSF